MSDAAEKIMVACPACARKYFVTQTSVGRQANCKCGTRFTVEVPPSGNGDGRDDSYAAAPSSSSAGYGMTPTMPHVPSAAPSFAGPACTNHPDAPAAYGCAGCKKLICTACDQIQADGSHLCPACATAAQAKMAEMYSQMSSAGPVGYGTAPPTPFGPAQFGPAAGTSGYPAAGYPQGGYGAPYGQPGYPPQYGGYGYGQPGYAAPSFPQPPPVQGACKFHPEVAATVYCQGCRTPICGTCDFQFPGGIHCCPKCATNTDPVPLSPTRKGLAYWSLGLAIGATVAMAVGFLVGAASGGEEEIIMLIGVLVLGALLASIVGAALGFAAYDKRAGNPPWIWIGPIWSSIVAATFILMFCGGLMMALAG